MRRVLSLCGIGLLATLLLLAIMTVLPHDRYIRWQDQRFEAYARLGWMYERIHFDPTPIDVAFIGTSHSMNGIDGAAVQREMAAAAAAADASGRACRGRRRLNVVNFAIPSYGRNLHWVIARELLRARPIRTLVVEVTENETRQAHPLFISVADAADVIGAPVLVNTRYLTDLLLLPMRQALLWAKTLAPAQFGLRRSFDPAGYDGPDVDNTRVVQVGGKALTRPRERRADPLRLDREAAAILAGKRLHMLGNELEGYEYAVPNRYLPLILDLARARGVQVVFLYLPSYGMPPAPLDPRPYEGRGEMLFVNDVLARPENWGDVNHLNQYGAAELSARLGNLLPSHVVPGAAGTVCPTSPPSAAGS